MTERNKQLCGECGLYRDHRDHYRGNLTERTHSFVEPSAPPEDFAKPIDGDGLNHLDISLTDAQLQQLMDVTPVSADDFWRDKLLSAPVPAPRTFVKFAIGDVVDFQAWGGFHMPTIPARQAIDAIRAFESSGVQYEFHQDNGVIWIVDEKDCSLAPPVGTQE